MAFVAPQGAPETAPLLQGTLIVVKDEHPEKVSSASVSGVPLKVTVCKFEQLAKADLLIKPILLIL